jgi:uncharacterized membrane protein YgdD (TMEM256/DUF423 family)
MTSEGTDHLARRAVIAAGVLGATGVALGAFGAHGLKAALAGAVDAGQRLEWWDKAAHYHLWHALLAGLFALGPSTGRAARAGLVLTIVGVVLFSGSLYAMALSNVRILGAVTPLGGCALLAAWLCLASSARRLKR